MDVQEKKGFACDECDHVSQYKRDLDRHRRKHTGERPYSCNICGKSFAVPGNRNRHQLTHTGEKRFQCGICSVKFTEKSSLDKHMRIHTGKDLFECSYCDKKFTQKGHLNAHTTTHTGEKLYKCHYCDKSFARKEYLESHIFTHEKKSFACGMCEVVLSSYGSLKRHRARHIGKRIVCPKCGKGLTRDSYNRHMKVIHGAERQFQCDVCSKTFETNERLEKHSVLHDKRFKCSVCLKQYLKRKEFCVHMQQHSDEFYNCSLCNIGFVCRSDLDMHWTVHPDEPNICSECNEVFASDVDLKTHRHRPTYENILRCPFCGQAVAWKRDLLKHVARRHADKAEDIADESIERPIDCHDCERKFSTDDSLLWHEICDHKFIRQIDLADKKPADISMECDAATVENVEIGSEEEDNLILLPGNAVFIKEEIIEEDRANSSSAVETFGEKKVLLKDAKSKCKGNDVCVKVELDPIVIKEETCD